VDQHLPMAILSMQVDLLNRPEDFDERVADMILGDPDCPPEIKGRKDTSIAIAWVRAKCGDRIPSVPPPAFLIEAAQKYGAESTVAKFLMEGTRKHHRAVMSCFKPRDFANPNEVNTRLRDIIVNLKDKPDIVHRVWKLWPLMFEWVASWDRYTPENMKIQRDALTAELSGKMTSSETRTYVMKKYDPKGFAAFERAVVQEAAKKAAMSDDKPSNIE